MSSYYTNDFAAAYAPNATPDDILISGITFVDEKCVAFFDSVEQMNRKLKVGQSVFFSAGNQVQMLMRLANQSALAIAHVAAAVEVTKVLLEQYSGEFAFAPHSIELRAIVLQAMERERVDIERVLSSRKGSMTRVESVALVKRYAQNCTLGNIREQWNRAIAKAVTAGVKPDGTVAPAGGAGGESIDIETRRPRTPRSVLCTSRYVVR